MWCNRKIQHVVHLISVTFALVVLAGNHQAHVVLVVTMVWHQYHYVSAVEMWAVYDTLFQMQRRNSLEVVVLLEPGIGLWNQHAKKRSRAKKFTNICLDVPAQS